MFKRFTFIEFSNFPTLSISMRKKLNPFHSNLNIVSYNFKIYILHTNTIKFMYEEEQLDDTPDLLCVCVDFLYEKFQK